MRDSAYPKKRSPCREHAPEESLSLNYPNNCSQSILSCTGPDDCLVAAFCLCFQNINLNYGSTAQMRGDARVDFQGLIEFSNLAYFITTAVFSNCKTLFPIFVLETSFKATIQGQQRMRKQDRARRLRFVGAQRRKLYEWDTLAASDEIWQAAVGWVRGLRTATKHDFYKYLQQCILELALSFDSGGGRQLMYYEAYLNGVLRSLPASVN